MNELSAGKYDVQRENVSGGEAVFEAVGSPSIFGYIAADGADALRGWVGGVEVARWRNPLGDMAIDDAGLNGDPLVGDVDGKDTVHAREADDNAARGWKRATRESGAGASGDEGYAMPGTDADDGLNFFPGAGQDNGGRQSTKSG
jgi:hypothetical protein